MPARADYLEDALILGEMGFAVFLLGYAAKKPIKGANGCSNATTDADEIERRWTANPAARGFAYTGPNAPHGTISAAPPALFDVG